MCLTLSSLYWLCCQSKTMSSIGTPAAQVFSLIIFQV